MAGGTAQNPTPPCATLEITPDVVAAVNLAAIEFQRKYRLAGFSTFSTQSSKRRHRSPYSTGQILSAKANFGGRTAHCVFRNYGRGNFHFALAATRYVAKVTVDVAPMLHAG